jgi:hypothetical protein
MQMRNGTLIQRGQAASPWARIAWGALLCLTACGTDTGAIGGPSVLEDVADPDTLLPADADDVTAAADAGDGTDAATSGAGDPCASSKDCVVGICDLTTHVCIGCLTTADCTTGQTCNKTNCIDATSCTTDSQCKTTNQVCATVSGICVDCVMTADCATGATCGSDNTCKPAPKTCSSSKDCAKVCDKSGGVCVDCLVDADCTTGEFCNGSHACQAVLCDGPKCVGHSLYVCANNGSGYVAPTVCDDKNACTTDSCAPGSGCTSSPMAGACDDGNACTSGESCATGTCAGGSAVACDDGVACTDESCEPVKGCQHLANTAGCDDKNPCTDDTCASTGCVHTPNTAGCDDGNACTGGDKCSGSACSSGTAISCNDGDDCTTDSCAPASGCVHSAISGCIPSFLPACGGQTDCKSGVCDPVSHMCVGCLGVSDCSSGNACEKQKCVPGPACGSDVQCKATSQVCNTDASVCVDCKVKGDCASNQACVQDKCVAAPACTSSKDCTAICDTNKGVCVGCLSSKDCLGGEICDAWQACVPAYCKATQCAGGEQFTCVGGSSYGAGTSCDDGNDCTLDSCASGQGCAHTNVLDGVECGAGAACGNPGKCVAGSCTGGDAMIWQKAVGGPGSEVATVILQASDSFVLGGRTMITSTNWDVQLTGVDKSGAMAWQQSYGTPYNDELDSLIVSGSGYVLLSSAWNAANSKPEMDLFGLDSAGKKSWQASFPGWVAGRVSTTTSGFEIAANQSDKIHLLATDAAGTTISASQISSSGEVRGLKALSDGFVVAGDKKPPNMGQKLWIVRTNTAGLVLWEKFYGTADSLNYWAFDLAELPDGFLVVGQSSVANGSFGVIVRTDLDGNLKWQQQLTNGTNNILYSGQPFGNGLLLVGSTSVGGGPDKPWIVHSDAAGNSLWQSTPDLLGPSAFQAATVTTTGLAFTGYLKPPASSGPLDILLARTDFWGNTTCATSGICGGKTALGCDDANPCTIDQCDAAHSGCWHTNLGDGLTCATGKTCATGVCK